VLPEAKRSFPYEVKLRAEAGSTWATSRRHARSLTRAERAALEIFAAPYVPRTATPTLPVLNPSA
jgi:hypothetical protein